MKNAADHKSRVPKRALALPSSRPPRPVSMEELLRYTDPDPADAEKFVRELYRLRRGRSPNRDRR